MVNVKEKPELASAARKNRAFLTLDYPICYRPEGIVQPTEWERPGMVRLLVTGGCGFIGSNFIRHVLTNDPTVHITNLDSLTYAGMQESLADVADNPRYSFVWGDITDSRCVRDVVSRGVHVVINFAAESHVDRSIFNARPFLYTNVLGTQALLDAAREFSVARFVQVSTDEVYGSLGDEGFFTERTPLAPNSPYSASKAAADMLVRSYVHTFGLPAMITRCSNNYGPYQFPEKLIPLFISNLLNDESVPVYGDGLNVRDWIHVEDHCRAIDLVWRKGRPGDVYNVGGRHELSNIQLAHRLLAILDKPRSLIRFVPDRPGHDRRYAIDCGKIERELGWCPEVPFDNGLRDTVAWYRNNAAWTEAARQRRERSLRTEGIESAAPQRRAA